MPEIVNLSIDLVLGFGYCPPSEIKYLDDGTRRFEYRYIPWPLQYPTGQQINAALNEAARRRAPISDLKDLDLPDNIEPEDNLTDFGLLYWKGLPLYATLTFKEPWIIWDAFFPPGPDGQPSLEGPVQDRSIATTGSQFDTLMHEALPAVPQNRWAQLHFKDFESLLPTLEDGTPCAMGMAAPLPPHPGGMTEGSRLSKTPGPDAAGPIPPVPQPQSDNDAIWDRLDDIPRAHPMERVEYPAGLLKRFWLSLANDQLEWAQAWEEREPAVAKLVEGAASIVPPGAEEFEWHDHGILRLETAARLLPRLVHVLNKYRMGHQASWAHGRIEPCYIEPEPNVSFTDDPVASGYRAAIVLHRPYFTYDPTLIDQMLANIRRQWR